MRSNIHFLSIALCALLASCGETPKHQVQTATADSTATKVSDADISEAYIYLLGRMLVLRQQQLDFQEGFKWNELVHRKPGQVNWPNPNLDVAYSEAWVAVDENSYVLVEVPEVKGRYYVVQFLNGWGETLANINPRVYPKHPHGTFAICYKGSNVQVPKGAVRVDLPVKYSRVLARVELGAKWDDAVALQHKFTFKGVGNPPLPQIPKTPIFDIEHVPGVEVFDAAVIALNSEADLNPGMEGLQKNVRAIAEAVKDPAEHARVDKVIHEQALPEFGKAGALIGHGTLRGGWVRPSTAGVYGDDYLVRTLVDYGGLWANVFDEVIYYKCALDSTGAPLHSDNAYSVTFPKNALPTRYAQFFWSVIAVDNSHMRVLPNPKERYLLNNQSGVKYGKDGSLTLYFAPEKPKDAPDANWLPTPKGQLYRLTFRYYGPRDGVKEGTYWPPPLHKLN